MCIYYITYFNFKSCRINVGMKERLANIIVAVEE